MRSCLCVCIALLVPAGAFADQATAAKAVLERTVGKVAASKFEFETADSSKRTDGYIVTVKNGRVKVTGTTGVAMARGAYDYLKKHCHGISTWEGSRFEIPDNLPDWSSGWQTTQNKYRHYFNVCTFGYTTAFWDWNRWREEIDWMALHGINMPLAMTGEEAAWQKVWQQQGLTDEEIRTFYGGPAFLPWHRMGNINSHLGPLPQSWIDGQAKLQKRILDAERELGMTPVVPAFSGFVPPVWAKKNLGLRTIQSSGWAGFEPTVLLHPNEPKFKEIGAAYVREYRKMFGSDHLYLADVFNEMRPTMPPDRVESELKSMSTAVYEAIKAGDPDAIWVMQGWLFLNEADFWTTPRVEAFLGGVPDDRMVLLDLAAESVEIWRKHESFRNKPWIWNVLHNFGQNTSVFGRPRDYVSKWKAAIADANHGRMSGMGLTPEGIEQNALVYELVTDMMWSSGDLDYDSWLKSFARNRYGVDDDRLTTAWQAFYDSPVLGAWQHAPYQIRPSFGAVGETNPEVQKLVIALTDFLKVPGVEKNPLYQRDAVDFAKVTLGQFSGVYLANALYAFDEKNTADYQSNKAQFFELLRGIAELVDTQEVHRLRHWVTMARSWGTTSAERDLMEANAKTQVTIWGGPVLYDYAAKEWSGLIDQFYTERWKRFFDSIEATGKAPTDLAAWEAAWAMKPGNGMKTPRKVDAVNHAKSLLARFGNPPMRKVDRGIAVGARAFDSGHTEPGGSPANAVDGLATGKYWAASPAPQWWAAELAQPETIDRITVFAYPDSSRYYKYTIETSMDGEKWVPAVDFSQNTEPSTRLGYKHTFAPVQARFVRVSMLHNSANIGVHLVEVRVFRAEKN